MENEPTEDDIERARVLVKSMAVALGNLAITGDPAHRRQLWDGYFTSRARLDLVLPGVAPSPEGRAEAVGWSPPERSPATDRSRGPN